MFNLFKILYIVLAFPFYAVSQDNSYYGEIDTIKWYAVQLSATIYPDSSIYKLDNKRVSKRTYEKYKAIWDRIDLCTPCYMRTYDINEDLLREGLKYKDCGVGIHISYHPNGKVKEIGDYKINGTGKWKNIWKRGYCSSKHGYWKYYDELGNLLREEFYKDGKLKNPN